jgi:hypothetical protein
VVEHLFCKFQPQSHQKKKKKAPREIKLSRSDISKRRYLAIKRSQVTSNIHVGLSVHKGPLADSVI